jgi:copper(I)-binding protein
MMKHLLASVLLLLLSSPSFAEDGIIITDAWVRASLPGQQVGAAYLTIESKTDARITHASSSVSNSVEIHTMQVNNGVMQMRALTDFPLEAGKSTKFAPGGLHLMLIGLKDPLVEGAQVEISLNIESAGKTSTVPFKAPVRKP